MLLRQHEVFAILPEIMTALSLHARSSVVEHNSQSRSHSYNIAASLNPAIRRRITRDSPDPGHHSVPRTYLVCAISVPVPLLGSSSSDAKVGSNKDCGTQQCPIYGAMCGCCHDRQQCIDGHFACVVWAEQIWEERVRWELVAFALDAKAVEIGMVGMLECLRCENGRNQAQGTVTPRPGGPLDPDGDIDGQVEGKAENPVCERHAALASRRMDVGFEHATETLQEHEGPHKVQLAGGVPESKRAAPVQRGGYGDEVEVGEVAVRDLPGGCIVKQGENEGRGPRGGRLRPLGVAGGTRAIG